MKRRASSLLLIIVVLFTAFPVAVPAATVGGPPRAAPPTGPPPTTIAPADRYVGPTANLTAVANALELRHKSLTLLLTVKPRLVLTNPVTITVTYSVPATSTPDGTGFRQYVQSYVASTGNRFLFNDAEGDGKPRRMHFLISLVEPKPGGGARQGWSYNVPVDVNLDPLYDVTISPLDFTLIDDCDRFGDSEIYFSWYFPDGTRKRVSFNASAGKTTTVGYFAWARAEVSASANLRMPAVGFSERDPEIAFIAKPPPPSNVNLVPGKTQLIKDVRQAENESCRAELKYPIRYQLRWYPYL